MAAKKKVVKKVDGRTKAGRALKARRVAHEAKKGRKKTKAKATRKPALGAYVVAPGGDAGRLDSIVGTLCNIEVECGKFAVAATAKLRRATKAEEEIIRTFIQRVTQDAALKAPAPSTAGADDLSVLYAAYAQRPMAQRVVERVEDAPRAKTAEDTGK